MGTMASVDSLKKQQFYGHSRNHLWGLIFNIIDEPETDDYEKRKEMLLSRGIALFDVIESCERMGSLDKDIKSIVPNDIPRFLDDHPNIRAVFFNGTTCMRVYDRHFERRPGVDYYLLPSSSPVPRQKIKTMQDKLPAWSKIGEYIGTAEPRSD
jgi:hypoxanthine-DNA glycosylase